MNSEEKLLYFSDKVMELCTRKELKRFDGFMPIDPEIYEEGYGIFTDATTDALSGTVDVAIYTPGQPNGNTKAKRTDQLCRLKALSHKEFRRKTGEFAIRPYYLEVAFDDSQKNADAFVQEINKKFQYVEIGGFKTTPVAKEWTLQQAQLLLGVQFNLENQCYVYLRPENAEFGFKYPLESLQQVKELFSLRDIPNGYKRRAALRHWVAKHMRHKPSSPDELTEVRRHLRGREKFSWFGINGEIFVNT